MPEFKSVGYIDDSLSADAVAREYRRRYSLSAYHQRRADLVRDLGGICYSCGGTDGLFFIRLPDCPGGFDLNKLAFMGAKRLNQVLPSVGLLCREHKGEYLYNKGRLTHGTYWAAYKKKCSCDDCEEYRFNRALERREDRRAKKQASVPMS